MKVLLLLLVFIFQLATTTLPSYTDSILTRSTAAKGTLMCGRSPANGVYVRLFRNKTEDSKELLATTVTGEDGTFSVEGTTAGRLADESHITPTLKFYHKCDHDSKKNDYRKFSFYYNNTYVYLGRIPRKSFDLGTLNLELVMPKESIEKKFDENLKPPTIN